MRFFKSKQRKLLVITGIVVVLAIIIFTLILYFALKNDDKKNPATTTRPSTTTKEEDCMVFDDAPTAVSILGKYKNAAVSVDSAPCSTVAKDILLQHGSVVDAAIAAAICDGVFNPQSMGIGGGFFMLIYLKENKKIIGIDARETAFARVSVKQYQDNPDLLTTGGLSVAVPGEIAGYWRAYEIGGRLPWKKLFVPTINFCRNGITVSETLQDITMFFEEKLKKNDVLTKWFIDPKTNRYRKENDTIYFPELANTLEIIAEKGPDAFYNGELSQVIVNEINLNGGNFTLDDLKNYKVTERKPIEVKLTDKYRAYVLPSPSSGILVTFILNVMKRFNLSADNISTPEKKGLYYHRLVETFKHAFAFRYLLGDESFENVRDVVKNLTDDTYVDFIYKRINDNHTFDYTYYGGGFVKEDKGTAHVSILAQNGDAVSMTSTINYFFGAVFGGKQTGIIYNNEMDDFSTPGQSNTYGLPPNEANYMKPGKRPMSSMSPIIVVDENDDVRLVLGGAGGTRITTSVAATALANLFLGMNIKEAIDEPRVHHQLQPDNVRIEYLFTEELREALRKRGHKLCAMTYEESVCVGVERRPDGELWANSDYRKGGQADGF